VNTRKTEPTCPACGGPGKDRHYRIEHFDLHRCRHCRTEFLVVNDARTAVGITYWDGYKFEIYADDEVRADYEARYRTVLDQARRFTSTIDRVVDVGCGIGNFLDWVRSEGMAGTGADVDDGALAACADRGLDAMHIDELPDRIPDGSVDLITLWDVIEHISEPLAAVERLVPLLRPGGIMAFETPDVSFPLRPATIAIRKVVEPVRWSDMLYYADHQIYFSEAGLTALLESAGLEVMEHLGMRSPHAKMERIFDVLSAKGSGAGKLGPLLYGPLDAALRTLHLNNKMIVLARAPWDTH
jgi:2-polyprenyl-3-methyl-5-hydroxy-6-metoxy-1,4-benzoquinol methylase